MEVAMAMKRCDECPDREVCDVPDTADVQFWPPANRLAEVSRRLGRPASQVELERIQACLLGGRWGPGGGPTRHVCVLRQARARRGLGRFRIVGVWPNGLREGMALTIRGWAGTGAPDGGCQSAGRAAMSIGRR